MSKALFLTIYKYRDDLTNQQINASLGHFYEGLTALLKYQNTCFSKNKENVEKDVRAMLEKVKDEKRKKKAVKIMEDLEEKYKRYDWVVIVYKTMHAIKKVVMKPIVSGFKTTTGSELNVAVARQLVGPHKQTKAIKTKFDMCRTSIKKKPCSKLEKTLKGCGLTDMYKAIHSYYNWYDGSAGPKNAPKTVTEKEEDDFADVEGNTDRDDEEVDYIFKGTCGKTRSSFKVIIKSDQELDTFNPCTKLDCKNGGKCVTLIDFTLAKCECVPYYWGEFCENDFFALAKKAFVI